MDSIFIFLAEPFGSGKRRQILVLIDCIGQHQHRASGAGCELSTERKVCGLGGCARSSSAWVAWRTHKRGKQDYPICRAQLTLSGRAYRLAPFVRS